MTGFALLSARAQYLLVGILFLAAMGQMTLCLYQQMCKSRRGRRLLDGMIFLFLLLGCAGLQTAAKDRWTAVTFPAAAVPLAAALVLAHAALGVRRAYRESRGKLSPDSVKQALDNLNSGVLFADETGKAVLVNRAMGDLSERLIGSYPQTRDELEAALRETGKASGVEKLDGEASLYRFPDGRVWRFRTVPLTEPELPGFTQTTAQDMTELYETNLQLEQDNAALRVAIAKMLDMTKRLADLIPRQEALNLKIRIHDEIGASLIALTKLAEGGTQEDLDEQLKKLEHALIPFGSERALMPGTFEAAQRQAAEMNVTLSFDGFVPASGELERLVSSAALRCVTNCVHHAKGSRVFVRTSSRDGVYTVVITNDGEAPKGPIVEGGGLSALRRNVEDVGGEMHLSYAPCFALTLQLPERRDV